MTSNPTSHANKNTNTTRYHSRTRPRLNDALCRRSSSMADRRSPIADRPSAIGEPKSVAATAEVQYSVHDYKLNAATTNNDEKSIENPKTKATTTTTNDERRTTNDDDDDERRTTNDERRQRRRSFFVPRDRQTSLILATAQLITDPFIIFCSVIKVKNAFNEFLFYVYSTTFQWRKSATQSLDCH